ncbi:MAG: alpha-1,4-glucan--maltose-1-phosphate maltosyltransferase [Acidimicrobiales bacterium]
MTGRIVIDDLRPRTPHPEHPAKAVIGGAVRVSADIFRDGHSVLAARVRWRPHAEAKWSHAPMVDRGNDRWQAVIEPVALGLHTFVVEAWTDLFATWGRDVVKKRDAGEDLALELEEGAHILTTRAPQAAAADRPALAAAARGLRSARRPVNDRLDAALQPGLAAALAGIPDPTDLTTSPAHGLWVDRERALVGAWYELFPRSEGGLREAADRRLPAVAEMGFDVVYLPPVHPIGRSHRKGPNNTLHAGAGDPGSPWAIGSPEGGHTAVAPELGTLADFDHFVERTRALGMEVALDYALQCSADHPWVTEHPEWFHHRPDGSIRYAENPPKKYQDIYPINFWPEQDESRRQLWDACRDIVDFWIGRGVRIFRVDNPHTKPIAFWEWLIPGVQADHPEIVFLAEAFTRPKVMAKLAEVGFSQSYTYFTWRTAKAELAEYLTEVSVGPTADYMRPNFWPNTPDILSGPLRNGPPAAFRLRLVLAATMVPSYGIYSGYELCENEPASESNEEYLYSEKYELKSRHWDHPSSLAPLVTRLNEIRRRHPALAELSNVVVHPTYNDEILSWSKHTDDLSDVVLVVVNLDPYAAHDDTLTLDLATLGLPWDLPYEAHDELTGTTYTWQGGHPYVRLDPLLQPAHVLSLRSAPQTAPRSATQAAPRSAPQAPGRSP